ncbi:MAG TPA: hypothetical protein DCZ40_12975 [Lachnospiraceae bacterium]|nr:hypothetical protein [Lachnospiraceae bacterium]
MIDVIVSIDDREVEKKLGKLAYKAELVMRRASNRAISTVTGSISQEVPKRYLVKAAQVRSTLRTYRANGSLPFASVVVKGRHPGLEKFYVNPMTPARRQKGGGYNPMAYEAKVKKHGGVKFLEGDNKPFVAIMDNGHIGVFRRKNDTERKHQRIFRSKYKVKKNKSRADNTIIGVYGPAIPQMVKNEEIMLIVIKKASQMMLKRAEHEIGRLLDSRG